MNINSIKAALVVLASAALVTSCIEEDFPQNSYLSDSQVAKQPSALAGFVNAIPGNMGKVEYYSSSSSYAWDIGYPAFGMVRDISTEDFPVYDSSYSYFYYYETNTYLGEYGTSSYFWDLYYKYIKNCHNVLGSGEPTADTKVYFGIAHFYRALIYFDMARWYEFKPTGFASIDAAAESNGIKGLTVPILTEKSDETVASNCPRAPFYEMYRFILDDLEEALALLQGYNRAAKNLPNQGVVYGQMARVYLEMATRFDLHPEDLDLVPASVDLGFTSVKDCYAKAADYAQKAIQASGATVLTESEWFGGANYTDGFNTVASPSWMLGLIINKEMIDETWKNFTSFVSSETSPGLAGILNSNGSYSNNYKAQRMIGAALYSTISKKDWRRKSWIDPEDAGNADALAKYPTSVPAAHFVKIPAYSAIKFRPVGGERTDVSGFAADYPLMRVEEMYLIRAEALASAKSVSTARAELEAFVNTRYTDGSYKCKASNIADFRDEVLRQKRIEFWGEGLVMWDYKRLEKGVTRGYEGTNFCSAHTLNSNEGYCAPWYTLYILRSEIGKNPAMKPNPDPSSVNIPTWN